MAETVGELRKRLAETGAPWVVDPRLSDNEPLPDPPRGGQLDEEIPPESALKPIDPNQRIEELIASEPPSNAYLLRRWAELGLVEAGDDVHPPVEDAENGA